MPRGFENKTTPYEGSSFALDIINLRREMRTLLPPSRAIDAQDVAELLDTGNEHSIARVFRQKLALFAARQLIRSLVLTDEELDALLALALEHGSSWSNRAEVTGALDRGALAGEGMNPQPPMRQGIDPKPSAYLEARLRETVSSTPRPHDAQVYTPGADPVVPGPNGQPRYQRTANP
jgi:hypothetical protein